jgi:glycosyltransferase involved in cell wall biosynthesis
MTPARYEITVAIAAYNCESTIRATLDSCLAQTATSVEVLVVDDGSTDGTSQVLAEYGERIRVIRQPNAGLASARSTGMRAAQGKFIAWMDADDLCEPQRLHVQAAALRQLPQAVLVSTNFCAFSGDLSTPTPSHLETYYSAPSRLGGLDGLYANKVTLDAAPAGLSSQWPLWHGKVYEALLEGNFVHPPTVMMRAEAASRAGDCDASLRYSSDYEYFIRLARQGEFAFVPRDLLRYRLSAQQMSRKAVGGTMQLENIAILDRLAVDDPAVYEARRPMLERRRAQSYLSAAEAIGPSDRRRSLRLLAASMRHRVLPVPLMHALACVTIPEEWRPLLRSALDVFGG